MENKSTVVLASGGLDSTLISVMCRDAGVDNFPLFIDYGQRAAVAELEACRRVYSELNLPSPTYMNLGGFGKVIESGLTSAEKDVRLDAFTPCRNLLFLVCGASFAFQKNAYSISIGVLSEEFSLFPDQRQNFLVAAEAAIRSALGRSIPVIAPLSEFSKADVVALARDRSIFGTYSCHAGGRLPCGNCISCLEFVNT
ncbi:MAG: 7-cyano-7-deazaguanine synthase [Polaromonas sp.]|uniref:7-cyano-7-deazaguanine synthase n=1 Tax=Polaromonas sp. TaxID=1869339 RepID=UPI00248927B3|nr:7-cyano-7-deazaguanine synthase [Polaromonas sp.]MDI1267554.1 7-cyano-7-deazaguanine synthase [Polaromonas sp.]